MSSYGIHWFRRDLRVAGNPALTENWKKNQGRVLGFFCFDPLFLSRKDFSADRFAFFLQTLIALREELRSIGSDLMVLEGGPEQAFTRCFQSLVRPPSLVTWNRDYEPFARARDEKMTRLFQSELGCGVWTQPDHLLVEPQDIQKEKPYQVYTPFSRKWMEVFGSPIIQERLARQRAGLDYLSKAESGKREKIFCLSRAELVRGELGDCLDAYADRVRASVPLPKAGSLAAYLALKEFAARLQSYADNRDIPSVNGTSHFSVYLKNGSLTTAQVIAFLKLGSGKFLSELIWREFYYAVLYHFPHVEQTAFQSRFSSLEWENNPVFFEAWKEGRTGFPIVDAGMRQLKNTGWMHNRVRMIVASFLTKDLLIDWKWGERYFMEKLLDGDLAPNNGGWQWAASTGCDAQPYFRIFNPYLQSEKFDPQGAYIKKYVPELAGLDSKQVHRPPPGKYHTPLVDHGVARQKALNLFGAAKQAEPR